MAGWRLGRARYQIAGGTAASYLVRIGAYDNAKHHDEFILERLRQGLIKTRADISHDSDGA